MAPRGGVKLAGPGPNQIEADSSAKPRIKYGIANMAASSSSTSLPFDAHSICCLPS